MKITQDVREYAAQKEIDEQAALGVGMKGAQLEILTHDILAKMGCKNIQRNFVSSGGEEIDLTADYPLPSVGTVQNRRMVCECKAYSKAVDMPPWLKFLGMVYSEEIRLGSEVSGCFIALSGVNGNVSGHYDELRTKKQNLNLVKGDTLQSELKRIHGLCDLDDVNRSLAKFTMRKYRSLETAYYNRTVYWIVMFDDEAYTILSSNGDPKDEGIDELKIMVEKSLSAKTFVSLKLEAEAQRRAAQAKKWILSELLKNDAHLKQSALKANRAFAFTASEINEAGNDLVTSGWLAMTDELSAWILRSTEETALYKDLVQVYKFLFSGEPGFDVLGLLKSDFYMSHIDTQLVAEIQRIQGNLPLSSEDKDLVIKILKWSASAMLYSVQPDEMIVSHRLDPKFVPDERMDRFDRNYFFGQVYRSINSDLNKHPARHYLLEMFKIREIHSKQKILVKSSDGVELETDLDQRVGIGYLADGFRGPDGSNTILMLLMEDAPEPWDVAAWKKNAT
jgi:hypothetical protein